MMQAKRRLYHERIDIYRSVADVVLDNGHGYYPGLNGLEKLIRSMFNITAGEPRR